MKRYNWNERSDFGLGKTYRTSGDAFKDADYATGLWRCETDSQSAWRWIRESFCLIGFTAISCFLVYIITESVISGFIALMGNR